MITYRQSTPDDVALLQKLNDGVFVDNSKYVPDLDMNWAKGKEGFKYFTDLVNDPKKFCIIAENDGVSIGYLAAAPKTFSYKIAMYTELENMGVIPEFQSKGVGSQLIERYLKWSKDEGYEKSYVSSFAKNTGAIAFYKKHGFSEIDISLERDL